MRERLKVSHSPPLLNLLLVCVIPWEEGVQKGWGASAKAPRYQLSLGCRGAEPVEPSLILFYFPWRAGYSSSYWLLLHSVPHFPSSYHVHYSEQLHTPGSTCLCTVTLLPTPVPSTEPCTTKAERTEKWWTVEERANILLLLVLVLGLRRQNRMF